MGENRVLKKGHTYKQWLVAILANASLFTYGMENSWISPMTKVLQSDHSPAGEALSDYAISWIASLMCFSAVFGTAIYAYIADRFGRKIAVMGLFYPQALSWIIKLYPTPITLTISRIVGGLPAGGCFNIVPMFIKEISQDSVRGTLGSLLILSQNLGVLSMYIIGAYCNYYTVQLSALWIPIVAAMLMFKAPEAPAYLVKRGKIDPLFVGSYMAITVSFATLAASLMIKKAGGSVPGWLPLVAMILSVFFFAGGISSIFYIILTEIFNFQIRAKVLGMVVTYVWFVESLQLLIYAPISNFFGYHTLFFIFTGVNLIGAIFTLIYIPETKGRTEEEVQRVIRGHVEKA